MQLLPEQDIWRALAIYQDQEFHLSTGKSGLSTTAIERLKNGKTFPSGLTWDDIHLSAQFQGSYYSFRILKQIISTVLLFDGKGLPLALHRLHTDLESLPMLEELPPVFDIICNIGNPDNQRILEMVQGLLGIQPVDEVIVVPKKRNKKDRKKGDASVASKSEDKPKRPGDPKPREDSNLQEYLEFQRKKTNNIFEFLTTG
jgi:hypothetical protein